MGRESLLAELKGAGVMLWAETGVWHDYLTYHEGEISGNSSGETSACLTMARNLSPE